MPKRSRVGESKNKQRVSGKAVASRPLIEKKESSPIELALAQFDQFLNKQKKKNHDDS